VYRGRMEMLDSKSEDVKESLHLQERAASQ
jgi:hypothetical protein